MLFLAHQQGMKVGAASTVVGGAYNAIGYFATGSTVTITIYDLSDSSVVATDSASCAEIGTTGVFVWSMTDLTVCPIAYTQYGWKMTDGADITLDQAGTVTWPEPFTISRLNPVLHR